MTTFWWRMSRLFQKTSSKDHFTPESFAKGMKQYTYKKEGDYEPAILFPKEAKNIPSIKYLGPQIFRILVTDSHLSNV